MAIVVDGEAEEDATVEECDSVAAHSGSVEAVVAFLGF